MTVTTAETGGDESRFSSRARLAVVTGAQRGIGAAIARVLACAGYDVVIADLHTDTSAVQLRERWGCSTKITCLEVDVADENSVKRLFDLIGKTCNACPDVVVNNAGTQVWGPLIDMAFNDWQRTLDVNLTGTFLMTREFARRRRAAEKRGGAIVNLGSGCNRLAFPQLGAYTASKGGVEMLTKAAAFELGEQGIRVNCVAPGAIETERTQAETVGYAQSWSALTPMGRIGTVNDVANTVLALVGDNMGFVSGETINVDGGLFSRAIWPSDY